MPTPRPSVAPTVPPSPEATPAPAEPRRDPRSKRQPRYAVVLHNDDLNTFAFVILQLRKVFGYSLPHAGGLTLEAHVAGRAQVWVGMREHAELKAEQLVAQGPDPTRAALGAKPLRVTVEPLPEA